MACLSCQGHSITKTNPLVLASLPSSSSSSSSSTNNTTKCPLPQSNPDHNPPIPISKTNKYAKPNTSARPRKGRVHDRLQQRLTLIKIERAVGAGSYRDSEPRDMEQRNSAFKGLLPNSDFLMEGPVEKKLRETGEWVTTTTEGEFRSAGKRILMFVYQWVLPIYVFLFLVASGIIKLPFSTPWLDDLIM